MTIRTKIVAVMVLPFVVLVTATSLLLVSRARSTEALSAERKAVELRGALDRVFVDLSDAETGTRGYLLTGDEAFLEPYTTAAARLPSDMSSLGSLTTGTTMTAAEVAQLQVFANQRLSILQSLQLLAPVNDLTNHDQLNSNLARGRVVMDEIRGMLDGEEREAARTLEARERRLDASRNLSFLIAIVAMPLGLLASLIVVALFTQRLVRRIRGTEELARRLEEGVPLTADQAPDDELGRLERVLVRSGTRVIELQGELRRLATVDPLTRLTNRRGFLPTAKHRLEVSKRAHEPVALLFIDLDGLKRVNDSLGHAAGDSMIAETAYVLRRTFRASDLVARMGGDEFCVLFGAESRAAADGAIVRLQQAVDETNAQADRPFTLSFSAGLALFDPEDPIELDRLMADADGLMYAAKRVKADAGDTAARIG